ncbi:MAG: SusC/RagA family TonB-linked outer membrane protein [Bacteroidota bacterium]
MRKLYLFCCFWIFFSFLGAQGLKAQHQVSGKVVDSSEESLIGVNIVEKGTSNGVITDVDGNYTIEVEDEDATLVFSFIGFEEMEVPVEGRNTVDVTMEESASELDEVVVVGYGTQRKESVTGSVSSIDNEKLDEASVSNMSTVLGGRLPGLVTHQSSGAPGADDATMLVRGRSTTGNSSPTVIVDGVQRSFNNLDPNEIEDITILKDASAAAVYGVQGANGVILVTTKRGAEGEPRISYKTSYSVSENTRFPKFMDGAQYAEAYNEAREMDELPIVFSDDDIDKIKNGDPEGKLGNTNWVDELFDNNSPTEHHNLSVEGGNEKVRYFLSAGYFDQEGSIDGFNFRRYNLRSNVDANITQDLKVSLDLAGRLEDRERPYFGAGEGDYNNLVTQAIRSHPYMPTETPDGEPTGTQTASSVVNPLAARDKSGFNNSETSVFESSMTFDYNVPFLEGLSLKFMGSYDIEQADSKVFNTPYRLQVFDINSMDYDEQWGPNATSGLASLTEGYTKRTRTTVQPSIRYNKNFNDRHDVSALLLYEQSTRKYQQLSARKRDFDFTDLPELDFGKEVPEASSVGGSSSESPRAGFVSRLNYSFDRKYLVELASRYDGSYRFHKDRRWGFFPAASIGWIISSEDFFMDAFPSVTHLKLKASAGQLGNDQIGEYMFLSTMDIANEAVVLGDELQNSLYTGSVPNRDITWETTTTYNGGFEAQFLDGKYGLEFDWFYKKTTDILQSTSGLYPPSMGGNYPATINSGIVDNRGFDLTISHDNQINEFTYGANLNVNWSRNKIIKTDDSPNIPDYIKETGRSIGEKEGLIAEGLFRSDEEAQRHPTVSDDAMGGDIRYKDLNGDGKINYDQDRTWIGKSNIPELMFGLNLYADWRGFDFSALVQGGAIADLALMGFYPGIGYDNTEFTRPFYHGGNSPVYLIEDSWTYDNPDAKYPRLSTMSRNNNAWSSTFWIRDASYARLKNLQFGYTLPDYLVQQFGIESLRVYVGGTNLFTLSEFEYLDPEAPDVNNGYYPQQKKYTFGINLTL